MVKDLFARATSLAVAMLLPTVMPPPLAAKDDAKSPTQFAAAFQLPELPRLPGLGGPSADWRQWDSFFTFVVKRVGQDIPGNLRDSLAEAFLNSRYELTNLAVRAGAGQNPVPQLFLNGWNRLSPVMKQALPALPKQSADRYASFISAADKLAAFGQTGSQLGLLQISPDSLRGMARLLQPTGAVDPTTYSVGVDSTLRELLGFGASTIAPGTRQSRLHDFPFSFNLRAAWSLVPSAVAAEPGLKKLNEWVPGNNDLEAYLMAVRSLLTGSSDKIAAKSKLVEEHRALYRKIVFTAAWQESCWRQYIKRGTPLASATGDLGLMQVNRNTWRNLYDLTKLSGDIEYNSNAGGEILLYYLSRYALRKDEGKAPGGNLARATYSAYNGGPSHLTRYRAAKQNPELQKVDEAFWDKFQAVSSGRELEVQRCYEKK
jgi:hypothetical protein